MERGPLKRPVCANPQHRRYFTAFQQRFGRVSHHTAVRQIHERNQDLQLRPQIPVEVDGQPGDVVEHTLRARKTHCVMTAQWSCGSVLSWGKCYESESITQVFQFMESTWPNQVAAQRPDFLAYDNACNLLRYMANHFLDSEWIRGTRFIVDAFHYIGHSVNDRLCRFRCNPAPQNGSQPDLISQDPQTGRISRAFNTETAEQLNSWLTGFESQTAQMSNHNFDFFLTSMLHLYDELTQQRLEKEGKLL